MPGDKVLGRASEDLRRLILVVHQLEDELEQLRRTNGDLFPRENATEEEMVAREAKVWNLGQTQRMLDLAKASLEVEKTLEFPRWARETLVVRTGWVVVKPPPASRGGLGLMTHIRGGII
ncbi:MAG: hypothetical protein COU11_00375 [Candidatus Harrisonbacteria bacterium CG10_big_fil_rev_8_21_14_0_10_49_15]|uniref:Uncharacterized protein n=1 Tax=Candidatus Harrisonbacteria bacterium CG10_big_fil_rev_8_21_14_0_10_49_15 TaxID=1974587 RepID=A0A2H0UM11_9BACT|nr:MAG: hypothetical protein COU11_00375 [Candidatus Harrisonbacteria bacterium CG10_big_fil_rev_8_21_14_0_10_49_15]